MSLKSSRYLGPKILNIMQNDIRNSEESTGSKCEIPKKCICTYILITSINHVGYVNFQKTICLLMKI